MKFTIGIPVYKITYLKECIDSILSQTCLDYELVIVNDASPENVDSIVSEYNSVKIKYYKNEKNFGANNVVDNWNKCLSYANGKYFILMGDDDMMSPNYLEEFSNLIEKFPLCNVYHCRAVIVNEQSVSTKLTEPRPEFESVYDSILERLKGNRTFFISDYVFKTNKLKTNGGFYKLPLAWASDDITSYIAANQHGIAHTNKLIFMYRQNPQTITTTGNVYDKMQAVMEEEKWLLNFLEYEPESQFDSLLRKNIKKELSKFIQKRKVGLITYSLVSINLLILFNWFRMRRKYKVSFKEILYAILKSVVEKQKVKYEKSN